MDTFIQYLCVAIADVFIIICSGDEYTKCSNLPECLCDKATSTVNCADKNMSTIPDVPRQTESLHFENNKLKIISTYAFKGLPMLIQLFLSRNKITALEPYAFEGLEHLKYLTLDKNQLVILDKYSLANMPNLQELNLMRNDISFVDPTAFNGSSNVKRINLSNNKFSNIPDLGYQQQLEKLNLNHNNVVNATFPATFKNGSQNIAIDLSVNKIEVIRNVTFKALAHVNLTHLHLSDNKINNVESGAFEPFSSVSLLRLKGNPLNKDSIQNIANGLQGKALKSLSMSRVFNAGDNIKESVSLLGVLQLKVLMLTSNSISILENNTFSQFRRLVVLDLSKNKIQDCPRNAFRGLESLEILNLAENLLEYIPEHLPLTLRILDLRQNSILSIGDNTFHNVPNLQKLNLKSNLITEITKDAFSNLGSLQQLYLPSNNIYSFPGVFNSLTNLTQLDLSGNNLKQISLKKYHFNPLVSLQFLNLADNKLQSLKQNIFEPLTSLVSLHLERNNFSSIMNHYGGQLFSGLKQLEELYLTSNNIMTLPGTLLNDQLSLKILKADHNLISSWSKQLFKFTGDIEILDLSHNKIAHVGKENMLYLNSLKSLLLKNNPFSCNCDLLWFRDWIDKTKIDLPDKTRYKCNGPREWRGKLLLEFDDSKLDCSYFTIYSIVVAAAAGLIISVIIVIAVYRFRWHIRLRVYLCLRQYRTENQNRDYEEACMFDAYISYSDKDTEWIKQHLLPGIDNGELNRENPFLGDFRLHYDDRDKEPGNSIIGKIFENMARSRNFIVVLTNNYVKDHLKGVELDQAVVMLADDEYPMNDIIIIKIGDIRANRIPNQLYTRMRNGSFIEWENNANAISVFREKLKDRLSNAETTC